MTTVTIKPCGGGVNKDLMPSELDPAQWSDALNMRFANGFAERRRGILSAYTTPAVTPYGLGTYVTNTSRFIVQAGTSKVYVDDGTTQTEITRYTEGVEISSITRIATTATLKTESAHGRTTGDEVTVYGAFPDAFSGTFPITVVDAETFTYTMANDPGSNATTVGQYSYNVQDDFNGDIDDRWSIWVFNGVLVMSNGVDSPQFWNGDVTTRLRRFPGWPTGQTAYSIGVFKNYLIAIAPTVDGVFQPHNILWSESAEAGAMPQEWRSTSTNDAGDSPQAAEASGSLITGLSLGDSFIIYGEDSRFALNFIGGNDVFSIHRLTGDDGLLGRGCVVSTPEGHVFLSNGDVKIHVGGACKSIAEGRIRRFLFSEMDSDNATRSFLSVNPQKSEVWVVFPTFGSEVPNKVVAWNWNDDTWGIFEIPPATCAATGLLVAGLDSGKWEDDEETWISDSSRWHETQFSANEARMVLGHSAPDVGLVDTGTLDLGEVVPWRLEKSGTAFGNAEYMKVLSDSWPQVMANPGVIFSVYHTTTKFPDDEPTYPAAVTYTVGTTKWASRFSTAGHFLSVKYEGVDNALIALRSYLVKFTEQGMF